MGTKERAFCVWVATVAVLLLLAVASGVSGGPTSTASDRKLSLSEPEAERFLRWIEPSATERCNLANVAAWNYDSNITEATKELSVEAAVASATFLKTIWQNVTKYDWTSLKNETVRRQYWTLSNIGTSALSTEKTTTFANLIANMSGIYASTKICRYQNSSDCTLNLDPEITKIMSESRDYDELAYYWTQWHDKVGAPCKPYYEQYVKLGNEAARLNGEKDYGDLYRFAYETDTLETDVAKLWQQLRPFYLQLHAYVRKKLVAKYGADKVLRTGPIPAHLLGNMWSQSFENTYDFTKPFDAEIATIDSELASQNYTVERMFRTAESFYVDIGLQPMVNSFWNRSILTRPTDGRDLVCHASAWDFCNGKDYRIKMCTVLTEDDFITIHHEMGHIEYFMQYRNQPYSFRQGANPGFHEAIGDTIALSVSTTKHLEALHLLPESSATNESDLNFLFHKALEKVAFLPFGYAMDYYRWRVFSGEIPEDRWNEEWWRIREELQGIIPPNQRSEKDFDPAAKYHVVADVEYMRYFVSFVIQFQFHKGLCTIAGQYDPNDPGKPLHHCDINKSEAAGKAFGEALSLGSSKRWPEVMKLVTGSEEMDARPIIEYFRPLMDFLEADNNRTGETLGWSS